MSRIIHIFPRLGLAGLAATFFTSPVVFALSDPSLLPEGREAIEIRSGERNPFAVQIVQEKGAAEPSATEGLSEEARIRRILGTLRVTGATMGPGKKQALMGSLIVKPGDTLPALLNNQSEVLKVLSLENGIITLVFHERDPSAEPRRIMVPVNLRPTVTQFLFGEAVENLAQIDLKGRSTLPPLTNPAVTEVLSGSQASEVQGLTEREVTLMGVVHDAKPQQEEE